MTIAVIGLDWPRTFFKFMELTGTVVRFSDGRYGDRRYCRYFPDFRRRALEWKHAILRTTGRVRSPGSVMMYE